MPSDYMPSQMETGSMYKFRRRSLLGISVGLFLLYGILNFLLAIITPLSLHRNGLWSLDGIILMSDADLAMLGPFAEASKSDLRLSSFLVAFMDTMCAQMMSFAILQIAVVWFALRRGQMWALWAAALADLAILPYYSVIIQTYAHFGVTSTGDFWRGLIILAALVLAATALGWFGLRRAEHPASVTP